MKKVLFADLAVLAALGLLALPALAAAGEEDDPDQLALQVAEAQKANLTLLTGYSWKVRSALSLEGESKATSVVEVHFDDDGKPQPEVLSSESSVKAKRGLRGHRQKKVIEDFSEYLEGVLDQSLRYVFLSKGDLVDIFDRATITEIDGSVHVSATDLFVKGDSLHLAVDPETHLTRAVTFHTVLEEDLIQGQVDLSPIEGGPNRPERFTITIPGRDVEIVSETFDWLEQK